MMMNTRRVKVITHPSVEPVSLDEAKLWLKIDTSPATEHDDDDLIESVIIPAARELVEDIIDQCLQTQTLELSLDEFPSSGVIELPKGPLQSVSSIKYFDSDGIAYTLDTSNYIVDTSSNPGRVILAYGTSWPSFVAYPSNPIKIRYIAGHEDNSPYDPVDRKIKIAMRLLITHWYDNRDFEVVASGTVTAKLSMTLEALLGNSTIYSF